jgi:hypothetical protein
MFDRKTSTVLMNIPGEQKLEEKIYMGDEKAKKRLKNQEWTDSHGSSNITSSIDPPRCLTEKRLCRWIYLVNETETIKENLRG